MLEQHKNHRLRFDQQVINSRDYVLPFIEQSMAINSQTKVLEIGCGEGGVMQAFIEKGCTCLGVDLDEPRLELGREYMKEHIDNGQLSFLNQDVYDPDFVQKYTAAFDIVILKDVIEHIPEQEKFIPHIAKFLTDNGQIFFGFPPWYMPFGGHQQLLKPTIPSKLPYYHILPMPIYLGIQKLFGVEQNWIDFMKMTKETGISIERIERIFNQSNLAIKSRQWYLINPIYKFKFGLKPRKQNALFGAIPFLRNFLTTCAYYTVGK